MKTCGWCYGHGGDDGKPCPNCGALNRPAGGASEDATIQSSQSTGTLQTELLDLITLMPDSQVDEILAYISTLREARRAGRGGRT